MTSIAQRQTVCERPEADPLEQLRERLVGLAQARGFAGAVYMQLGHGLASATAAAPRFLAATPGFDAERYVRRGFLALDPLAGRARVSHAPFAWRLPDLQPVDAGQARYLTVMSDWGMREGIVAPVQDYAYGPSLLNLYGPCGLAPDHGALMLEAAQVHMAARSLPAASAPEALLNAREIEVLRLAAIGWTEQETALSLSLSRRGVQFHLAHAVEKLGAANKTAAVAMAVSAGLISL